jgi:hypothetical protein
LFQKCKAKERIGQGSDKKREDPEKINENYDAV